MRKLTRCLLLLALIAGPVSAHELVWDNEKIGDLSIVDRIFSDNKRDWMISEEPASEAEAEQAHHLVGMGFNSEHPPVVYVLGTALTDYGPVAWGVSKALVGDRVLLVRAVCPSRQLREAIAGPDGAKVLQHLHDLSEPASEENP